LAGIRLDPDQIAAFARRLRSMNLLKESSFYEMILREGRKEGEKKGQLREARKVLIRLGRIRFGRLDQATRKTIESIGDLKRLERLLERVHAASSWADLLAEAE
jgi:predicted transposase YdaD